MTIVGHGLRLGLWGDERRIIRIEQIGGPRLAGLACGEGQRCSHILCIFLFKYC
jgi:hypothetical protein